MEGSENRQLKNPSAFHDGLRRRDVHAIPALLQNNLPLKALIIGIAQEVTFSY